MTLKKIRTINSHVGYARYLAHTAEDSIGVIPRQADIPSPYRYSSEWVVFLHATDGAVVIVETRHKHYEVFAVPATMILAAT